MTEQFQVRTTDMPLEMQALLATYPRGSWEAHPGFKGKTENWLRAHQGFRKLTGLIREETEAYIDREMDADRYAAGLSYYGNLLVNNLHGHHTWEDRSYFPELSKADPRFDAGLEILEKDHHDLDLVLDEYTEVSNRVIKLLHLEEAKARDAIGDVHDMSGTIGKFLDRHLADEEELAVPIILHYRLRG